MRFGTGSLPVFDIYFIDAGNGDLAGRPGLFSELPF